ncbi:sensor histidine kinase [Parasutterella excrementihominis]|uniref:sensor histidine kinase n=1 Tax=Parasutterella excrementihominis TaxID=487175 RepID=UPI0030787210
MKDMTEQKNSILFRTSSLFIFAVLFSFSLHLSSPSFAIESNKNKTSEKITVGYIELSQSNVHNELIDQTKTWLAADLNGDVEFKSLTVDGLSEAIKDHDIDFVLSTSGFYREHLSDGLKDLATSVFDRGPNPNKSLGSVFIALKDNTSLKELKDLEGKSVSTLPESSFVGWQIAAREIGTATGTDPHKFFGSVRYQPMPMNNIVEDVLAGRSDAGILTTCLLEELKQKKYQGIEKIKVINEKKSSDFFCAHSTKLYASYTLSVLPGVSGEMARKVTNALLAMPPSDKNSFFWSIGTDFHEVDALLKDLQIGSFFYLRNLTLRKFLEKYWSFLMMAAFVLFGLCLHTLRTQQLVRIRTEQLSQAFQRQLQLQQEAAESCQRLEKAERQIALQHISGVLAHELKQPLTSMGYFIGGVIRRLRKKDPDVEDMIKTLEKVAGLTKYSSLIIENVREATKQKIKKESLDIDKFTARTLNSLKETFLIKRNCSLTWKSEPYLKFFCSPFELNLVLTNLVKNAVEAADGPNGQVRVQIHSIQVRNRKLLKITVSDNGKGSPENIKKHFSMPFSSEKPEGLGLGLSIIKRIAESYEGRVEVEAERPKGVRITVYMKMMS